MDEAQLIFSLDKAKSDSESFWAALKRLQLDVKGSNVRVVLAAAYGAHRSDSSMLSDSPSETPTGIDEPSTTISIHPAPPGSFSLRLTTEEAQELWLEWLKAMAKVQLNDVVRDEVASMCGFQVGK